MNLQDAKIIVTGAAQGMGRTFTELLLAQGAHVMASDIDQAALERLAQDLGPQAQGRLTTKVTDVANETQVIELVAATASAFGSVNSLINNAGIIRDGLMASKHRKTGEIQKMSLSQWQQVLDVNLTGPFLCAREVAAYMIEHDIRPGVIVSISSISRHGNRGQSNYSAAKAGLVADTKLWALELAKYGIRTGAVAPGFTRTPILEAMRDEVLQGILGQVPLGRMAEPEEIFQAVKFILECDYFTGRCIDVDGGLIL